MGDARPFGVPFNRSFAIRKWADAPMARRVGLQRPFSTPLPCRGAVADRFALVNENSRLAEILLELLLFVILPLTPLARNPSLPPTLLVLEAARGVPPLGVSPAL